MDIYLCAILLDLICNKKRIKAGGLCGIFPRGGVGIIVVSLSFSFVEPSHLVFMPLDIAKVILEFSLFFNEIINPLAAMFEVALKWRSISGFII